MHLLHANLFLVFLPVCLAGLIDRPALGDIGTGNNKTYNPGQSNGGLGKAATTGNLVAAIAGEDYLSSIRHGSSPLAVCNKAHRIGPRPFRPLSKQMQIQRVRQSS